MERRSFLGTLAGGLLAAPVAAEGQQAPRVAVGWLAPDARPLAIASFRQMLKELGWVEGQSLVIEQRYGRGAASRYGELAAELVRLRADVLVTDGSATTRAAQRATSTIPVVFLVGDPVAQGFVASLSRPGGNLTGVAIITGDLNPKRIQLLKEAVPSLTRLAVLEDGSVPSGTPGTWPAIESASRQEGLQLMPPLDVRRPDDLDGAFAHAVKERAGGILVLPSAFFSSHSARIVRLAARARLPAVFEHEEFAEPGGLLSYGPSHRHMFRRLAAYVDKILKGAKPTDLPIEQPTKFDLVINLKTAKALGLTIPPSLLQRADQVIE
jgi:putative ABC transport system substrate-binding protein